MTVCYKHIWQSNRLMLNNRICRFKLNIFLPITILHCVTNLTVGKLCNHCDQMIKSIPTFSSISIVTFSNWPKSKSLIIGQFCLKICPQNRWKLAQSGHTVIVTKNIPRWIAYCPYLHNASFNPAYSLNRK